MENEIKKAEIKAKIKSLEKDLIELQKTRSLAWTAFCVGVTKMENSLKEKLTELSNEYNSSNLNNTSNNYSGGCPSGNITKRSPISESATDENINESKAHSQSSSFHGKVSYE